MNTIGITSKTPSEMPTPTHPKEKMQITNYRTYSSLSPRPALRVGTSLYEPVEVAGNHPPVAGSGQRRKQAIRDQEKSGTRQIPKGRKRQETAVEGRAERKTEGQFGPHGSRRGPNPTTPHRTSGEAKEGRAMLPLRGPRAYVQRMPQKAQ